MSHEKEGCLQSGRVQKACSMKICKARASMARMSNVWEASVQGGGRARTMSMVKPTKDSGAAPCPTLAVSTDMYRFRFAACTWRQSRSLYILDSTLTYRSYMRDVFVVSWSEGNRGLRETSRHTPWTRHQTTRLHKSFPTYRDSSYRTTTSF